MGTDWVQAVRQQVADIAGLSSADDVDPDAAFVDLGFQSLAAVELSSRLEAETGLELPLTLGFDHPTPRALGAYLARRLGAPVGRGSESVPAAADGDDPVVIVGMSCRYPGGVRNPDDLWALVSSGTDAIGEFPADRGWDLARLHHPDPDSPNTSVSRHGGFLADAAGFDAGFFSISDAEALAMDPQQRLLLELGWELFEHAGIDPGTLRGSRTGVYVGVAAYDYFGNLAAAIPPEMAGFFATGNAGSVASGRMAYVFGLEGPALTVDTACSSSLVALHLAAGAVRSGECDAAVAGGVTVAAAPTVYTEFSRLGGLAPDGRCRSYAAAACGTGFSEGAGLLLVERLSRARALGHQVHAVVRGSAVNSDGASNGLSAPNGPAQERVILAALAAAGLRPSDVDAVEGHGTATVLGDPIEVGAILGAYGRDRPAGRPLRLGSLKSNIGHCQAAAGVGGVLKIVLALRHGQLPPTLHVDAPTPKVDWSGGAVSLLTEPVDWPRADGRVRRAGVSGFGFSGTNAHVLLEEPPVGPPAVPAATDGPVAWVVSARTEAALQAQLDRLTDHLAARPGLTSAQVAVGLAGRARLTHRAVAVGTGRAALIARLATPLRGVAGGPPAVAVLFPGQGSQRVGMGRGLAAAYPVFAAALDDACAALDPHLPRPLRDVLWAPPGSPDAALLDRTEFTQPALFAFEVALFRLVTSLGVQPAALLGHSIGELTAAHVAGVWSLPDAAGLVAARGRLMGALPAGGGMVSVRATEDEVLASLAGREDELAVAGLNGPQSTVVSGAAEALAEWAAEWRRSGRGVRPLRVSHAFHSPLMEPMLAEFRRAVAGVPAAAPQIPIVSTLTGEPVEDMSADYWPRQARRTVRFLPGMRRLESAGNRRYLELGPDGVLTSLGRDCLVGEAVLAATGGTGGTEAEALLTALGRLHADGAAVDFSALPGLPADRPQLPTYAFEHKRFWAVPAPAAGARSALVGPAVQLAGSDTYVLSGRVDLDRQPWLADHALAGTPLLSGTTFVELALRAGAESGCPALAELVVEFPLPLPAGTAVELQVTAGPSDPDGARQVEVYARVAGQQWTRYARGVLTGSRSRPDPGPPWSPAGAARLDLDALYERLAAAGLEYGPAFRRLRAAWRRGDDLLAEVDVAPDGFLAHPAALDAALHAAVPGGGVPVLPFSWTGVRVHGSTGSTWQVRVTPAGAGGLRLVARDETGEPAVSVDSVVGRPASVGAAPSLLRLDWIPAGAATGAGDAEDVLEVPAGGETVATLREVLHALQKWLADPGTADTRLVVLTRGAVAARDGEVPDPAGASVWGLVRSAQTEHPDRLRLLDGETAVRTDEPQAAVRDGRLLVPRLRPAGRSGPETAGPVPDRSAWTAGTVLVTGGTGGLGGLVAGHLVDAYGTRDLLLVSRRGGADGLARALRARGATVAVAACDVGDPAQLDDLLAGRRISAVVHAAGVLDDGVVQNLTADRLDGVLGAKAGAAMLLAERLPGVPFVLFSSMAGIVGSAGQAAYAAANACLDAIAQRRPDTRSLAWGRWQRVSAMTAGLDEHDTARLGGALSDEDGLALLDAALDRREPVLALAALGPAELRAAGSSGRVPAVLRELAPRPAVPPRAPVRERLARAAPGDRLPILLDVVRADLTAVLGADPAGSVDPDLAFTDAGLDSLKVVELRNRLASATGLRLPATVAFEQPTPRALATLLLDRLAVPDPPPAAEAQQTAEPDLAGRIAAAGSEELAAILGDLGVRLE